MRQTPDLIDALVAKAAPVRRLRPPLVRTAMWVALAAVILALLCVTGGLRPDLAAQIQRPLFIVSMGGALATALLAALAAFKLSLPDRSQWWLLLPLPSLAVWISTIGYGCLTDWVRMGPDGLMLGETVRCFATLFLTSVPLSVAMLVMLRHAAAIRPAPVSFAGGLAVAAATTLALSLIHPIDASVMILIWNLGVAFVIAGLASAFGDRALAWFAAHIAPAVRSVE